MIKIIFWEFIQKMDLQPENEAHFVRLKEKTISSDRRWDTSNFLDSKNFQQRTKNIPNGIRIRLSQNKTKINKNKPTANSLEF